MLHLFNNVLIEQDKYINLLAAPEIIIASSEYVTDDNKVNDAVIQAEETVEGLIGDSDWFTNLMSKTNKVIIYASNDNFAKIVATWLKSTTNMDSDAYSLFVDCYNFHEKTHGKINNELQTALKSAYEGAPTIDFSANDFKPSIEFLFASAMHDANFAKKPKLVSLLSKFLKRQYEEMILESRRDIDRNALNSTLQTLLGGSDKTLDTINELPDMAVFSGAYWNDSITITPNKSYLPGLNSKINISNATNDELDALVAVAKKVRLKTKDISSDDVHSKLVDDFMGSYTYIHTVKDGTLSNEQYDEVIASMISNPIETNYLPTDLEDSIIKVFLSHLKSLKQASDLTALQKFALK